LNHDLHENCHQNLDFFKNLLKVGFFIFFKKFKKFSAIFITLNNATVGHSVNLCNFIFVMWQFCRDINRRPFRADIKNKYGWTRKNVIRSSENMLERSFSSKQFKPYSVRRFKRRSTHLGNWRRIRNMEAERSRPEFKTLAKLSEIATKNWKFPQKSKIWSKVENLINDRNMIKYRKFDQRSKVDQWSKIWPMIENLTNDRKFDQWSKFYQRSKI